MYTDQEQSIDEQISEMKSNIVTIKSMLETVNNIKELTNNKLFQEVILKGYIEQYALGQTSLLSQHAFQDPIKQATIQAEIRATGSLRNYLDQFLIQEDQLLADLKEGEELLEELIQASNA